MSGCVILTEYPRSWHNDVQSSEFLKRGFEGGFQVFPGGDVGADEERLCSVFGDQFFGFGFERYVGKHDVAVLGEELLREGETDA